MQHVHFGAGLFGLGFAAWVFGQAGVPVHMFNREASPNPRAKRSSSSVDAVKKEPSVSSYERNNLLRTKLSYFVLYPSADDSNSEFDLQRLASFTSFDPSNLEEVEFPEVLLTQPLAVTFSLRKHAAYDGAFEVLKKLLLERALRPGSKTQVFLMAFENGIETHWAWEKLRTGSEHFPALTKAIQTQVIPAEVSVDRICFSMSVNGTGGKRFLGIIAEKHARLVIEDKPSVALLKQCFKESSRHVSFSTNLQYERLKKLLVVNGSHALTAIHVLSNKIKYLDDYLKGQQIIDGSNGKMLPIAPVDERQQFVFELILEIIEGFTMTLDYKQHLPEGSDDLTTLDQRRAFARSILERFSGSRDSVFRVIRNFIAPEPDDEILNQNREFFRSLRSKIERPVGAYMQHHKHGPLRTSQVLLALLVLIAEADYINRVHHYSNAVH